MIRRLVCLTIAISALTIGWIMSALAQPPPPKGPDKKGNENARFEDRLLRLRKQLANTRQPDTERQTLLWHCGIYADRADQISKTSQPYIADRTLAAAESIFHAADHLEHLKESQGPPPPPAEDVSRHLSQVYFRTRQADYFLQEIRDNSASPLAALARQYYQRAVQAKDRSDLRGADEYGKTAEELVKALENLAQAATLAPEPRR
jgi:hypothetical protein